MLEKLKQRAPQLWINPDLKPASESLPCLPLGAAAMVDAEARLRRFAPLLSERFPELESTGGIIESPLIRTPNLQAELLGGRPDAGTLLVKADHDLPVAGSIKARGGIYEVLVIAERLALEAGLPGEGVDPRLLNSARAREYFAGHTIAVGSTGNLGLSIGIMAAALGFRAVVHMSHDAKAWKKARLRHRGVEVVEHAGDFASAVAAGREQAAGDPCAHFIDDEQSLSLFLGYSVAALRLKQQLRQMAVFVDARHPLFVYIPCGVGGAPGGITFGLKHVFGDHVHCFLAEPVDAPAMLAQLALGRGEPVSVYELGLTNLTEADGLAVGMASQPVAAIIKHLVSGILTVEDDDLFRWLYLAERTERLRIEPSAAAGFAGPGYLLDSEPGNEYLEREHLRDVLPNATHILWTTGGAFVPPEEYESFHQRGRR